MKQGLRLGIIGLLSAGMFFSVFTISHPCDEPVFYHVTEPDARFGLSQEDFLDAIAQAEGFWEEAIGRELFNLSPSKGVKIATIYDDRQKLYGEVSGIDEQIKILSSQITSKRVQLDSLSQQIQAATVSVDAQTAAYNERAEKYNRDVYRWNTSPETSGVTFEGLDQEKRELEELQKELQEKQQGVSLTQAEYKNTSSTHNQLVEQHNQLAENRNKLVPEDEYQKAVYDGESIFIYQFEDKEDLVHVLAHELGHALGLEHVDDPQAVMYWLVHEGVTNSGDANSLVVTESDISAAREFCGVAPYHRRSFFEQIRLRQWLL